MRKFKLPIQEEITNDLILDLIDKHHNEKARIQKMKRYYKNHNDIEKRPYTDPNKPHNILSHGYARYITDTFCGYFLGEPVAYKSENKELLEKINDCFMYNDETDNNIALAHETSICGYAYEILYVDEDSQLRFKGVPTEEMIVVYDNTIEEKIQFAIRYYNVYNLEEKDLREVVLYTKEEIVYYSYDEGKLQELQDGRTRHFFGDVPVSDYENNNYRLGDFEPVISLIDAYDKANSDTANDFEYFTNAMLVISGVTMDETDEQGRPLNFKDNRVLNFIDSNSKAEYLIKDINDTALENYKNRLNNDIHKFSNVVDMSDENFANNLSGIAIKYKLMGMENVAGIKEAKFKKGLMRRIELASNILSIKSNSLMIYTDIRPVFTRNLPVNETETVNMAKSLAGIISEETMLSLLPFIEDVQAEQEAIKKEKEESMLELEDYQFGNNSNKEEDVEEDGQE